MYQNSQKISVLFQTDYPVITDLLIINHENTLNTNIPYGSGADPG